MKALIKILCLTKNSNLIQDLDQSYELVTCFDHKSGIKHLSTEDYHLIILDLFELKNEFTNDFKTINRKIYEIKDLLKNNAYLILLGTLEDHKNFINNTAIDNLFLTPYSSLFLINEIKRLYNKRNWDSSNVTFFFQDEISILIKELNVYLNRTQAYYYNEISKQSVIKKLFNHSVPESFILNTLKCKLIMFLIQFFQSKNVNNYDFSEAVQICEKILKIHNINYELLFDSSFIFSSLNYGQSKYFAIGLVCVLMSMIIEKKDIKITVTNENMIQIITNSNSLLNNNLFSNIVLSKILNKKENIIFKTQLEQSCLIFR